MELRRERTTLRERIAQAERFEQELLLIILSTEGRIAELEQALLDDSRASHGQLLLDNLQLRVQVYGAMSTSGPNPQCVIQNLLDLAHPDTWNQGQLVTELTHELTVRLEALRGEVCL